MRTELAVLVLVAAAATGCGSDGADDAGLDDSGLDAGSGVAECGNGVVEDGELCDDGNGEAFDGCEPDCTPTCASDADCSDEDPCNGVEVCDPSTTVCRSGAALDEGTACAAGGVTGICVGPTETRRCAMAGCGNGFVEAGEECDDGANGDPDDGCRDDCTFTCRVNDDCGFDGNVCDGANICDPETNQCVAQGVLECLDANACTADTCDPLLGCQNELIDNDSDGEAPTLLGACGTDCNDMDPNVGMTATERCNGADDDCDGVEDNGFDCPQSSDVPCTQCGYTGERRCGSDCAFATACGAFIFPTLSYAGTSTDLRHSCGAACMGGSSSWCHMDGQPRCDVVSGGPNLEVPPGRYEADFVFGSGGTATLRVRNGTRTLATHSHEMLTFMTTVTLPFNVTACGNSIGFEMEAGTNDAMTVFRIDLRRVGDL